MNIVIDLSSLEQFLDLPADQLFMRFLVNIGWILLLLLFVAGARVLWLMYIQLKWSQDNAKFLMLAIDVPRGNMQSPKAVENIFSYLAGAHGSINLIEKWWEGKYQLCFSLETISIDGYTQFLIRTPIGFRNLVESAVYSQYPDAEITEVNDYVGMVPHKFPDKEWDVWGAEFIPANNHMLPIKLYKEFEHISGPSETHFRDPMASLMDLCSTLVPGEQLWYQIILRPIGFDWIKEADEQVDKILGATKAPKLGFFGKAIDGLAKGIFSLADAILSREAAVPEKKKEKLSMMELTPKQKAQIEGLHFKASKIAFETKIRVVYVAKKEVMNKGKVSNGFVGYIKQFASLLLNNIKPDMTYTAVKANYFMKGSQIIEKKNKIIKNYVSRDCSAGRKPSIMNIEELATIWHFPIEFVVKAPFIQKAPGRKADAPASLPIEEERSNTVIQESDFLNEVGLIKKKVEKPNLDSNLSDSSFENNEEKKLNNIPFAEDEVEEIKNINSFSDEPIINSNESIVNNEINSEENIATSPEENKKSNFISDEDIFKDPPAVKKGSAPSNLPFA